MANIDQNSVQGRVPDGAYIPPPLDPLKTEVPAVTYQYFSEDEVSVADKKEEEFKPPKPEDPPIPPTEGKETGEGADTAIKANPWLNNPNVTALLFLVLLEYQKNMSIQRVTEADMKIVLSEATFKIGMENADLAKKLKDLEADKQFLEAMGNFASAAIAVGSIGAVVQNRKQATQDTDNSAAGKTRADEQKKMDDMKNNLFGTGTGAGVSDASAGAAQGGASAKYKDPQALMATPDDNPDKQAYVAQKQRLNDAERHYDTEFNARLQQGQAIERHASDAVQNIVQGTVKMISVGITQEQGALEKLKATNDTIQQFWSRIIDSASKSKEDQQAEINRVLQLLTSWSSETRNRIQRG